MDLGATTALVARITLAAAFGLSAATKLTQRDAFARALEDFGVPAAPALAWALPPLEAGLAVLLVTVRDAAWPAFLAIAVLAVFTAAVVANLAGGDPAPCPCFGPPTAGARPVSAATIARNGALVALAVLATGSAAGASVPATLGAAAVSVPAILIALRRSG
ncbi:MAG TPA: MauE/DoxX family redox-associated membrane protein [Acidimicrobiia bacterium]|nr:MauE/DoxX family redox-associated membrane protein [Acidimicrobiia bacterium]